MKKRLWIFYGVMFTAFCALAFRIYTLSNAYLVSAANKQSSVSVTVSNARGTIYDRFGVPLVNNGQEYRAAVISDEKALAALSKVMSKSDFQNLQSVLQTGRPAVVKLDKLAAASGITLFQVPTRYAGRVLAPHIIGYMDADLSEGLTGIEAALNHVLSGYNGSAKVNYTVDAHGRALAGVQPIISNDIAQSKGGVQLTLDADLQQACEDIAAKYIRKGAVVVMQADNGDILSSVSLPQFQPNTVADVLQNEDAPLLNRVLCSYNCGSVFKIVSAAAALESGKTLSENYVCNGSVKIFDNTFRCHYRLGHGNIPMETAFSTSCNCYFIQLMQQVGAQPLWQLANRLGFNSSISLCDGLQTKSATLPTEETLLAPAALANLSFGQGELTATPLHIAQLIATVVNDGKTVSPRLIKGYADQNGVFTSIDMASMSQQVFSASTAAAIRGMMEDVMQAGGTGFEGSPIYLTAGAKTGTAETGWTPKENEEREIVQSWFAGFYPAQNPQYVIVVLGENAYNTDAKTAPVFKEIAEYIYKTKISDTEE